MLLVAFIGILLPDCLKGDDIRYTLDICFATELKDENSNLMAVQQSLQILQEESH